MICFDTETELVQPGLLAPRLVCVSTARDYEPAQLYLADEGVAVIRAALEAGEEIIGHNLAYDFGVLCAHDPSLIPLVFKAYEAGKVFDTCIRQELLDIAYGRRQDSGGIWVFRGTSWVRADYSLAGGKRPGTTGLVGLYLNKDRSADKTSADAWRLRYGELLGVPLEDWPAEAVRYAKEDAADTLDVYRVQAGNEPIRDEDTQTRAAWALHLMSTWGIRSDAAAVEALETKLLAARKKNRRTLQRAGFIELVKCVKKNGELEPADAWEMRPDREGVLVNTPLRFKRNMERIKARVVKVYQRRGLPVLRTASGAISTEKDVLNESGSKLLQCLSDGGGVEKLLTTYIPVLKHGTDYPINARFNTLVNSGRTSCSAPNLQNLPTGRRVGGVRECFVPRRGRNFVSVDYDTLELRALSQVCLWLFGKSKLAEALQAGRDPHLEMAGWILKIDYAEVEARHKAKDPAVKRARDCAKVANFGLPGGLGAEALVSYARKSYNVRITIQEAVDLKAKWLAAWPEMRLYFAHISQKVGLGDATLESFAAGLVRGGVGYCDGCNHYFQNLAAKGAKIALFRVAHECYVDLGTPLYGSRPVAFIHDEILAEVPSEAPTAPSERLAQVMCEAMATVIPDVPITATPALMERWEKNATPVYVGNELVPWRPDVAKAA